MKIIACVDDEYGMMFNNRRQSKDREVINDIMHNIEGVLWISNYSKELFWDSIDDLDKRVVIKVDDGMLDNAKEEEWCFIEDIPLKEYEDNISEIIIYKWNKKYPADKYMEISMKKFKLIDSKEIKGYSHDDILREIYKR